MSRRYRLPIIATVGLILAGQVHAQAVGNDARSKPRTGQGQPKPKADAPPAIPVAVQNDIQRIARALETANNKHQSAKEDARSERDIAAQENMAFWAMLMFGVGLGEMAITGAGVFLVWRTLKASWAAHREAKRAADAAEKALASMDRPHLVIHELELEDIHRGPEPEKNALVVGWQFRNLGEQLGFVKQYGIRWFVLPVPDVPPMQPLDFNRKAYWPLVPQQTWGVQMGAPIAEKTVILNQVQRERILDGTMRLFIRGGIRYADIGGNGHEHTFIYVYRVIDKKFIPFDDERFWTYT